MRSWLLAPSVFGRPFISSNPSSQKFQFATHFCAGFPGRYATHVAAAYWTYQRIKRACNAIETPMRGEASNQRQLCRGGYGMSVGGTNVFPEETFGVRPFSRLRANWMLGLVSQQQQNTQNISVSAARASRATSVQFTSHCIISTKMRKRSNSQPLYRSHNSIKAIIGFAAVF